MFASHFQGGPAVEVFTTKGKNPLEKWKVFGGSKNVVRGYDRESKGYVYDISGGQTKLQLPADDRKHTLRLQQPFLVFQVKLPLGKSIGFELGFHDAYGTRRRLLLSSAFKEIKRTPLHTRLPLAVPVRGEWVNLCLDLQDLVSNNFEGQMFQSLDFVSVSAWCQLRKVFTLRDPPPPMLEDGDGFSGGEPIPANLDLEGAAVQLVRMASIEGPPEPPPSRPKSAAPKSASRASPVIRASPSVQRPGTAPAKRAPSIQAQKGSRNGTRPPRAIPGGEGAVVVRAHKAHPGERSAWCEGAGDIGSPRSSFEAAKSKNEDEFARASLQERRRHLELIRQSLEQEDIGLAAMPVAQPQRSPAPRLPVARSARTVWAEAPHGAAEHLRWHREPSPSPPASPVLQQDDFSSRYHPENSPAPSPPPVKYNPWGLSSQREGTSPGLDVSQRSEPELDESYMSSDPPQPPVRESAVLADAMDVYGQESRYTPFAVASPSPSQHTRSLNETTGEMDDGEDNDLWLSHSPESQQQQDNDCVSPAASTPAPAWLARPASVVTSGLGDTLGGTLGGTLFKPSDSPSPTSLSPGGFGGEASGQRAYSPADYSVEKAQPERQSAEYDRYSWSSGNVYEDCLQEQAPEVCNVPESGQGGVEEAGEEGEEDEELDLLYDPALNCYFDPRTGQYYELKDSP